MPMPFCGNASATVPGVLKRTLFLFKRLDCRLVSSLLNVISGYFFHFVPIHQQVFLRSSESNVFQNFWTNDLSLSLKLMTWLLECNRSYFVHCDVNLNTVISANYLSGCHDVCSMLQCLPHRRLRRGMFSWFFK